MDNHDLDELENPENWTDDGDTIHLPMPNRGIVLSFRLTLPEFTSLERRASSKGMKITDFVRQLALDSLAETNSEVVPIPVRRPA